MQHGMLSQVQADIVETLLHPCDSIPGYEILDLVGQGGMGVVYRARQQNLDRVVALKTVLVNRMSDANALSRFEQEAMAVARLHHPHIVAAYDFGRHAGRVYLAMEWLAGEDVERLLRRLGALSEATAWGLARQAAAGLAHAAEMKIVHRDIKPANLLVIPAPAGYALPPGLPMVKIADFGLAFLSQRSEEHSRLTADGSTVGTPHYLAPEQLQGAPVDFRADVYALGATVFHMLTGNPPFFDKRVGQIMVAKLSEESPSLAAACPSTSTATAALVARMMARDPERRPGNYLDLLEEIDAILANAPRTISDAIVVGAFVETPTLIVSGANLATSSNPIRRAFTQALEHGGNRDAGLADRLTGTSSVTPVGRGSQVKRRVLAAVAGFWLLTCLYFAWFSGSARIKAPELVESGWQEPLFAGTSLKSLKNLTGAWKIDKDDESAQVLSGAHGILTTEFPSTIANRKEPPEFYRLTLHVQLHQATQAEVRFGFPPDARQFFALRISLDSVQLGRQVSTDRWQLLQTVPARATKDSYHVVQIERQPSAWKISWDEKLVGTIPANAETARPEFRLQVEAGPAWFSDVVLTELVPPATSN